MISKGIVNNENLKNHKVLKLICPSIKNLQSIYSRAGKKDPPSGLIGLKGLQESKTIGTIIIGIFFIFLRCAVHGKKTPSSPNLNFKISINLLYQLHTV